MWIILSLNNIILSFFANKYFKVNKTICKFALLCLVVTNTFILGLRDFGVGADTLSYVKDYFFFAASLHNVGDFFYESYYDKGYVFLAWISTLFGNNPQALLVITELFIISILTIGIYRYKRILNCDITWFMIFFVLMYQFETINLMRQFCAMSVLIYGFSYYLEKKIFRYALFQILAYFFHSSSIVFIIVPFVFFVSEKDVKTKFMVAIGIITFFAFVIGFYMTFLNTITDTHLLNETYASRYGENSIYENDGTQGIMGQLKDTAILFLSLTIVFFAYKYKKINQNITYILVMLLVCSFLLSSMRMVSIFFFRLGYYVGLVSIIYLSIILKTISIKKMVPVSCIILLLTINIYGAYRYYGYSRTGSVENIYKSSILSL